MPTGEVEVVANAAQVLNEARTTPFYINEDVELDEALRLKYRYLDLRRPAMQKNIILRHQVVNLIRNYMNERGFLEIETPDPDQDHAGRRARLRRALAACIRASSTRCRSRRSSSSNC